MNKIQNQLDGINAAVHLTAMGSSSMRNHTSKRDSSLNISDTRSNRKASKQNDTIGDVSDKFSSMLDITGATDFEGNPLDVSSVGGSSSIVELATPLVDPFGKKIAHNASISTPFLLSPWGIATSEASNVKTPLHRNKLFPTDKKKKKKKKKKSNNPTLPQQSLFTDDTRLDPSLPNLPTVDDYMNVLTPPLDTPRPHFSPDYDPKSIKPTVIYIDNKELSNLATFYRMHDKYLSHKYHLEYLIHIAQDITQKELVNRPHYVMIIIGECVPPSTGISLEGRTGAYLPYVNQQGCPSFRFIQSLAKVGSGALPPCGFDYKNGMNCMFGEARTDCKR